MFCVSAFTKLNSVEKEIAFLFSNYGSTHLEGYQFLAGSTFSNMQDAEAYMNKKIELYHLTLTDSISCPEVGQWCLVYS